MILILTLILILFHTVSKSGIMPRTCNNWKMTDEAAKAWARCAAHFIEHANILKKKSTSGSQGFVSHAEWAEAADEQARALTEQTNTLALLAQQCDEDKGAMASLRAELTTCRAAIDSGGNQRCFRQGDAREARHATADSSIR